MRDADVVIVGAGAAGLSLAHRLCGPGHGHLSVALVDAPPGPLRPPERTWCFWERPGGEYDAALAASWELLRVRGREGAVTVGRPAPLRYKMLPSRAFESLVAERLDGHARCRRVEATVTTVRDTPAGAEVRGHDTAGHAVVVRGRWVFDSRPPRTPPPARTALLQHFHGWFVHADHPVFDPSVADLMDFRTPQPRHGLSFGYVLPLGPYEALVEYTEFSRTTLREAGYDAALRHYTEDVLGLRGLRVTAVEHGVIPMTDARFPRGAGRSVFRLGTAAGATRPATGYTFSTVQRQTRAVAEALRHGRTPLPPRPHRARSRAMDAVLLRALDQGRVDGAEFFTRLFTTVPTGRLLRFLDGCSGPTEDLRIGLRTPVAAMLRTSVELPFLPRRSTPRPAPLSGHGRKTARP